MGYLGQPLYLVKLFPLHEMQIIDYMQSRVGEEKVRLELASREVLQKDLVLSQVTDYLQHLSNFDDGWVLSQIVLLLEIDVFG